MVTKLQPLYEYSSDVFSQNGEDGIISFLFQKLQIKKGLILEVGAHNGVWCSNTRNLYVNNFDFKALLIEGNNSFFSELQQNTNQFNNVEITNDYISTISEDTKSIDSIIDKSKFNSETFVLASIDIDGSDYEVWKNLKAKPIIVIIEVPIFLEVVPGKKNIFDYIELGKKKNYTFLGMSGYLNKQAGNMIFLNNNFVEHFELPDLHEQILLCGGIKWATD